MEKKPNSNKENFGIVNKLINDLGGIIITSELLGTAFNYLLKFDRSKKLIPIVNFIRETVPVALTSYKLYTSIKEYFDSQNSDLYDSDNQKRRKILDTEEAYCNEFMIGKEIVFWLIQKPHTKEFTIAGFYDYNLMPVDSIDWSKEGMFYILLKDKSNRKALIHIQFSFYSDEVYIRQSYLYTEDYNGDWANEFRDLILKEFISNYNIKEKVIVYTRNGVICKKKEKVEYKINQFDFDSFTTEIKNSIEMNKKRGYVFCGPPGTGKTSIVAKLENQIDDIPFIYVAPNTLESQEDMMNFFGFARSIKPCIIIFEDLDSYEDMEDKNNSVLGFFIESVDSINQDNCGIIVIATVNYTNLIDETLINRRGRFDKIFYISGPKHREEVYSVMKVRYEKETQKEFPLKMKSIKGKFFNTILKKKFTQSDICEVIDNLMVLKKDITNETLMSSLDTLIDTQIAFKKSFKRPFKNIFNYLFHKE